ncbi:MAG: discoidin domain-containing protein [Planctomycetes bacterium]|jgi:hypothetical protein|nr:discoidin domain-containing protein [Planctomycetota bacterium]
MHLIRKLLAVAMLLSLTGCEPGMSGAAPGSVVSPRRQWKTGGTLKDPHLAIDANASTSAVGQAPGDYLLIDLGGPSLFNYIRLTHSPETDFPPMFEVSTGLDENRMDKAQQFPGTRKCTNMLLVTPRLARFIRIQAAGTEAHKWSLADVIIR